MSVLDEICEKKRKHVEAQKNLTPLEVLREKVKEAPVPRGFINALLNSESPAIIAEIKKASPSKGIIRQDFDPERIASIYENHGAACISVLTDEPYFLGHDEYLLGARRACSLPVLRKDFILDPYQVYESRDLGADCILLIMAALNLEEAKILHDLALELGMDVLVEVHNLEELEAAKSLKPRMIGVNNRDLQTLDIDVKTSLDLVTQIPAGVIKIAESGISDASTIERLQDAGYGAFLVGESLMRENEIGSALDALRRTNQ